MVYYENRKDRTGNDSPDTHCSNVYRLRRHKHFHWCDPHRRADRTAVCGLYGEILSETALQNPETGDHAANIAEWVEFSITGCHHDAEAEA